LKDMCVKYPLNKSEILDVSGVGEHKAEKYGTRFIEVIKNYIEKNNIDTNKIKDCNKQDSSFEKHNKHSVSNENKGNRKLKEDKEDTRTTSYRMYKEGKTIVEIASKRELNELTIENHLIYCAKLGYEINFSEFVSPQNEELIVKTYKKIGGDKLKPIKEALPPNVTYSEIKFALCKYSLTGDKNE